MSLISFYLDVLHALEEIDAPYMIVGAFGASTFGLSRATADVDIIVALQEAHCDMLAEKFPPPRYYADPDQMREGMQLGIMFNLIDGNRGAKADLVPLSREPDYVEAFNRRVRRTFRDESGATFDAWCARADDIIVGKLLAWEEGQSAKHPNDIAALLRFDASGMNARYPIDLDYVTRRAAKISPRALELWRGLVQRFHTG